MKTLSQQFLIGLNIRDPKNSDKVRIELLKNTLIKKGLTEANFTTFNGKTYLNLEGTLLTCKLEKTTIENNIEYEDHENYHYQLYCNQEEIASMEHTVIKNSNDTITALTCDKDKLNRPPDNLVPLLLPELKTSFLKKHVEFFKKEKAGFFGCLRRTQLNPNWSLKKILEHEMSHDNRTRHVCIKLGWLTKNGDLSDLARDLIKKEITSISNRANASKF